MTTAQKLMGASSMEGAGKYFLADDAGRRSIDMFLQTPQLKINILRDQAASYGISPTRIETLLRNAYSQNYVYLIKQPTNQYQVILETEDRRSHRAAESRSALHQVRRRHAHRSAERGGEMAADARAAVGEPSESIHQRDVQFQSDARRVAG